ncbi:MAG: NAD(P)-binding protein [Bryobacteraceae bacterium]|nr:NAD(P)-binding protein [Bryobacteraceae bacterium]
MHTRRDFLNGVLLGSGAALLHAPAPAEGAPPIPGFNGPGGVGDYALSNGNRWEVLEAAHRIRDGAYRARTVAAADTGERFDLVIVGAGMSGLGAALRFSEFAGAKQTCLLLDNHAIFGGESKRNEMIVDGVRLFAPQGANEFDIPSDPAGDAYKLFQQLRIPMRFEYREWPANLRRLEFDRTNYGFQHWLHAPSFGHLVEGRWVRDFWTSHASDELKKWKYHGERYYDGKDFEPWLDSMTYKEYIERVMGLSPRVTAFADPILAAAVGLGCDALSAYAAYQVGLPGFRGFRGGGGFPLEFDKAPENEWHMFPGGNAGLARYAVKALLPSAIGGGHDLNDVVNGRVQFDELDRPGARFRFRLSSTVVRVEQSKKEVAVTFECEGRLHRVRARAVVMASGSWINRHIVADLPEAKRAALGAMLHSPVLVANAGVRHWRFLYDLGITSARWTGGFGFCCNVRQPMSLPGYRPPFSPDAPTVLTFYIPYYFPGLPARDQGAKGRMELLGASYAVIERRLREQMRKLFGVSAERAIDGIILNRWGHAYVNPTPGFYFPREGRPAPPQVIREPLGRIAFGHSELFGHQFWLGAIREGRRAVDQLRDSIA